MVFPDFRYHKKSVDSIYIADKGGEGGMSTPLVTKLLSREIRCPQNPYVARSVTFTITFNIRGISIVLWAIFVREAKYQKEEMPEIGDTAIAGQQLIDRNIFRLLRQWASGQRFFITFQARRWALRRHYRTAVIPTGILNRSKQAYGIKE